jgi:carboxylesterase type B
MLIREKHLADKFWKGITSSIISHCENEAHSFTPKNVESQAAFDKFVEVFLPGSAVTAQRQKIRQRYDCTQSPFSGNFKACIGAVIQDAFFTCNTRNLFNAYPTVSRMLSYSFPLPKLAYHASDLIPLFMNDRDEAERLLRKVGLSKFQAMFYVTSLDQIVSPIYQNYLASFAVSSNPNSNVGGLPSLLDLTDWPVAEGDGNELSKVLQVRFSFGQEPFVLFSDGQNTKATCDFWTDIAKGIVSLAEVGGGQENFVDQMPLGSDL